MQTPETRTLGRGTSCDLVLLAPTARAPCRCARLDAPSVRIHTPCDRTGPFYERLPTLQVPSVLCASTLHIKEHLSSSLPLRLRVPSLSPPPFSGVAETWTPTRLTSFTLPPRPAHRRYPRGAAFRSPRKGRCSTWRTSTLRMQVRPCASRRTAPRTRASIRIEKERHW
jgi:hypothetical protein